jgi:hypothetical protein
MPGILQGPKPAGLYVWIYHWHEPITSIVGVAEQVPVPEVQPQASAVYHCWIFLPVESLTYSWYQVTSETAFQVYVGVVSVIVPEGETKVAADGGGTVNVNGALQGPYPALL